VKVLRVAGPAPSLTKAQRRFNGLIERLHAQRKELKRWQDFTAEYHRLLAERYLPLAARLREKRIAMAKLWDRAMRGGELKNRERAKLRALLQDLLSELLSEAQDAELLELHDRYAESSFGEEQNRLMQHLRNFASEALDVDVNAYAGSESPDEFADWLAGQEPEAAQKPRKSGAQHEARKTAAASAAEGGTRALRDVFRKLVSELHPDRESDPAEQLRKTGLMQRVNQAYAAGDLLGLLELQLSIEQIDAAALAGLAEERLRRYIHVLDEQSKRLADQLSEVLAPFVRVMSPRAARSLTPAMVQRALEADIAELKTLVREVDTDLVRFRDMHFLKASLKGPMPSAGLRD
jgi:hypothetical protein